MPLALPFARNPRYWIYGLAGLAVFLAFWEIPPLLHWVNPELQPPPSAAPAAFLRELKLGIWQTCVSASLGHYFLGLLCGIGAGGFFGVATGLWPAFEQFLSPAVRILRPIPGIAWTPFAIMWFGLENATAIFIVSISVFWIVFYAAQGAIRAVDRDLIEVAAAFGYTSGWDRLRKVLAPAALPGALVGVRTSLGQAWTSVVAAEMLVGVDGVGQRMRNAGENLQGAVVVVYMLTIAALYSIVDILFMAGQKWALRWKP